MVIMFTVAVFFSSMLMLCWILWHTSLTCIIEAEIGQYSIWELPYVCSSLNNSYLFPELAIIMCLHSLHVEWYYGLLIWRISQSFWFTILQNTLISKNFKVMEIEPYADGKLPSVGRIPWELTNRLFGCGNVGNNHWVLFQVCFQRQEVEVYDSLGISKDEIAAFFEELCRNIPKALTIHRVWENRHRGTSPPIPLRDVWDVVVHERSPKQNNLFDCGILCLKALECITHNIPFSRLDINRCNIYRRSFCAKLQEWSTRFEGYWRMIFYCIFFGHTMKLC